MSSKGESLSGSDLMRWVDTADGHIVRFLNRWSVPALRIALGVVYVWFGALKLAPDLSPAEDLVRATVPFLPGRVFLPVLAAWEITIGLGFLSGRALRLTILLLLLQMPGTMAPIFLLPDRVFTAFPYGLTLEGQYIVKNLVLIGAALVVGATVRRDRSRSRTPAGVAGGRPEPGAPEP
ncbi:MAG: DoxX family membrane protein [Gemmatimonadetes bacterium]|nr:DoxX family membrane protein [Gemmatimonadota bacterium]NIQ59172.1 DoxX family membrane protein [Gemmatimonadota bacterium]NIU79366.1 DoxX family membrane protein [Gammaproteobacteria bacterium]NIX48035.1 DoxX family membrane protein [Gemmatimonadota bacterium]NIY12414.1 DoxX family membrane protein [Gemmatimonadota bacterium]